LSQGSGCTEPIGTFAQAIELELGTGPAAELRDSASLLSQLYRFEPKPGISRGLDSGQLQAYLATRAPATFAATRRVLTELARSRPGWAPKSLADLGAGPGTASWAAVSVFPSIERAFVVEADKDMAALGSRLARSASSSVLAQSAWTIGDAATVPVQTCDLVVAAYLLGEIGHDREPEALERWWRATSGALVLVEPGTPAGFERLRAARSRLISWGAHVLAPCPHDDLCPMEGADWCHFAVRLERSSLHRDLKSARLGYEDEKHSYVVVSADRPSTHFSRLVRSPRPRKGHVRLVVCENGGLNERVISRRDGEVYKRARNAGWGDRLELPDR